MEMLLFPTALLCFSCHSGSVGLVIESCLQFPLSTLFSDVFLPQILLHPHFAPLPITHLFFLPPVQTHFQKSLPLNN